MFKVLVEFDLIYNLNHLKKMQYASLFVLKKKSSIGGMNICDLELTFSEIAK